MPKLQSLAITEKEAEERMEKMEEAENSPRYPYGVSLYLEEKTLEKLGIGDGDYKVGDTVGVFALGKVQSVSSREEVDGDKKSTIDIQLTDMTIEEQKKKSAKELYPSTDERED